ncbi:MAG: hypothetical protein KIT84_11875 [Labilithrix sp.]|nr:hypothetical protein [Labilithrix sp.]MCW5811709.1 hypothetical protein [Labilithrix sp.]
MTGRSFVRAGSAIALVSLIAIAAILLGSGSSSTRRWTFDSGGVPSDLVARAGPWAIESNTLVSREGPGPAVLLAEKSTLRDFTAVTRCKDECGIVFRYRDDRHYEIVRLDPVTQRAILASVSDGQEHLLASAPIEVVPGSWHELRIDTNAGVLRVALDRRLLIATSEGLYASGGAIGLWAPPGVAYFDELSIAALTDSPRTLGLLPAAARPRG